MNKKERPDFGDKNEESKDSHFKVEEIPVKESGLEGDEIPVDTDDQKRILEIEAQIARLPNAQSQTVTETAVQKDIFLKYIPKYLEVQKRKGRGVYKLLEFFTRNKMEVEGKENLPKEGPFLVISNHFPSDPASVFLLSTLANYDTHLIVSEDVHWRNALKRRWLEFLGTIRVPGTLSQLSSEDKELLRSRLSKGRAEDAYTKILDKDPQQASKEVMRFIRTTAALLARGDVVALYPEGHWLYDDENGTGRKEELSAGYRGIEVIAKQFKKYTGQDLLIVPIGIYPSSDKKSKVAVGDVVRLTENDTEFSDTDFAMYHLAALLPEESRGKYK